MKKLMIASVVAVAAMFTGCEVEEYTSCEVDMGYDYHICVESTSAEAKVYDFCKDANDDAAYEGYGTVGFIGSGCPGGQMKTCTADDGTVYLYGASGYDSCSEYVESY